MAIKHAGSQQALAKACHVTQAAVSKWANGGRISAESARAIEVATDGAVSARDLRPDIFGDSPPAQLAETGVASEEPPAQRRVA